MTTEIIVRCFGCGTELREHSERCETCDLDVHLLREIGSVHSKPHFLFGRVETPVSLSDPARQNTPRPRSGKSSRKDKAKKIRPADGNSVSNPESTRKKVPHSSGSQADSVKPESAVTPILHRDEGLGRHPVSPPPERRNKATAASHASSSKLKEWIEHLISIVIDIALLSLLNYLVIFLISLITKRSYMELFRFNSLPLAFVFLAISVVFIVLFNQYYHHSPGSLLTRKIMSGQR
jgi:hypothetical protein